MNSPPPSHQLHAGAAILQQAIGPFGFSFEYCGDGLGSGGSFAQGQFVQGDRRLELHFRQSLGGVAYHVGNTSACHETYMRALGVWDRCKYPGFSNAHLQVFRDLAHDLQFAADFVAGSGEILRQAALTQKVRDDEMKEALLASYQGQSRMLDSIKANFKAGKYAEVVKTFDSLPAPHLLSDAELKLVQIARRRSDA